MNIHCIVKLIMKNTIAKGNFSSTTYKMSSICSSRHHPVTRWFNEK